jgi:hypothetical protein
MANYAEPYAEPNTLAQNGHIDEGPHILLSFWI